MNWRFWKNWFKPTDGNSSQKENVSIVESEITDDSAEVISTVYITENLLERTRELLASFAENTASEGVVYWFGVESEDSAVVTTLVVPNADTSFGCIRTSPQANAQALTAIVGTPLILLGQAHSHPDTGVRHSGTDDNETFARFDGAISVVVPHFGKEGIYLETCGIHRHLGGAFRFIETAGISDHIRVLPGEADFRAPATAKGSNNNIGNGRIRGRKNEPQ